MEKLELSAQEEKKKQSEEARIAREKLTKDADIELQKKQIEVSKEKLTFEETEQLKKATYLKQVKIMEAEAKAEEIKHHELAKSEIISKTAECEAKALEMKANAKKLDADADAYKITVIAKANAESIALENEAKEKMPKHVIELKKEELRKEQIESMFKNGILYEPLTRIMGTTIGTFFENAKIGGTGPDLKTFVDSVVKNQEASTRPK